MFRCLIFSLTFMFLFGIVPSWSVYLELGKESGMPTALVVRDRILRVIKSSPEFVSRTKLIQSIGWSYRSQANEQISQMLSEGVLVQTGLGKRGLPFMIGFNQNYPGHLCPTCGQRLELGHKLYRNLK